MSLSSAEKQAWDDLEKQAQRLKRQQRLILAQIEDLENRFERLRNLRKKVT